MPIIDIHDLDKEEVAFALYENAHQKTREAVLDKDETHAASERLTKEQVAECLRQAQESWLETVGDVPFQIDFSSSMINTDHYDDLNAVGFKGIKSSQAVIEGLRRAKNASIPSKLDKALTVASEHLKQILQVDEVEIGHLYGDTYMIKIPSASPEKLTGYMQQLQTVGRASRLREAIGFSGALNDLAKISLELPTTLSVTSNPSNVDFYKLAPPHKLERIKIEFKRLLGIELDIMELYGGLYISRADASLEEFEKHFEHLTKIEIDCEHITGINGSQLICSEPLDSLFAKLESENKKFVQLLNAANQYLESADAMSAVSVKPSASFLPQYQATYGKANPDMVLIFLDIDGVMFKAPSNRVITEHLKKKFPAQKTFTYEEQAGAKVDLFSLSALAALDHLISVIEKNGKIARIVVSSNWRRYRTTRELKTLFLQHKFSNYIIDKTVDKIIDPTRENNRGVQIIDYIAQKGLNYNVVGYVALDDIDDNMSVLGDRFIRCDANRLFGMPESEEAIKVLGLSCESEPYEKKGSSQKRSSLKNNT